MRARIKETGEVLRVDTVTDNYVYLIPPQGGNQICLLIECVELLDDRILPDATPVDWEQRRYEIAKDAMAAFISAPSYQFCVNNNYYEASLARPRSVAEDAVEYADALIEELKKDKREPIKRGFQD